VSDDTELNGMEPTSPEEVPAAPAPEPAPAPAPAASSDDFLSTTAGKVVLIVGAVLVLLVVAGVVGWFVLGPASLGGGTGTPGAPVTVVPDSGTPATPPVPTSSTVTTLPVADITSRDVFTPRNPFTVIEPEKIATSTASTSSDTSTSTLDPDVVTVIDIKTVSGVRKAVIAFGGVTYTVGPGDSFGGHDDWTVVTVHTTSVDVLMDGVTVNLTEQHTSK
jgi:hypothetical protein